MNSQEISAHGRERYFFKELKCYRKSYQDENGLICKSLNSMRRLAIERDTAYAEKGVFLISASLCCWPI